MIRSALFALTLSTALVGSAQADSIGIRNGTDPTDAQLGHVFMATCAPSYSTLMEMDFALFETAFRWTPTDTDADISFVSPTGAITARFDSQYSNATCEMVIPSSISGDGAELYEGLKAHLLEEVDDLPPAEAIEGGLKWEWKEDGAIPTTLSVEFIETTEGHILRSRTD